MRNRIAILMLLFWLLPTLARASCQIPHSAQGAQLILDINTCLAALGPCQLPLDDSGGRAILDFNTCMNGSCLISPTSSRIQFIDGVNACLSAATPTPTPTLTPTPAPTPTPMPTPGAAYYIDNSPTSGCSDTANSGTSPSSPWCTVNKAHNILPTLGADQQVLFKCGDLWNEELDLSGVHGTFQHPIIIGHYGSNCVLPNGGYNAVLPVLSGGSSRQFGVNGTSGSNSYLVIDGFDIHDTTSSGILFAAPTAGADPGIVIQNNLVHQVGAGAYAGGGAPFDDNNYGYDAGLGFEDSGRGNDGVQFLNNTVWDTGGHNTMRIHYDSSPNTLVQGNTVGPGCLHNCIDTKGINGTVQYNIATCPTSSARGNQCLVTPNADAGFYTENTFNTAGVSATWRYNVAYNVPLCFQAEAQSTTPTNPKYYNNTCYNAARYALYLQTCTSADVRKNIFGSGTVAGACITTWDYNDRFGTSGAPIGPNDLTVNPQYAAPTNTPPDFHTGNVAVNTQGADSTVTASAYLGAIGPGAASPTPTPTPTPTPSAPITLTSTLVLTSNNNGQVFDHYRISTTSGPCVTITGANNVTISNSNIGPCGGSAGSTQSPSTDANGVELTNTSNSQVVDSYIHTETDCNTGGSSPIYTHNAILDQSGSHNLFQGNVIVSANNGISTGSSFPSPTTTNDTIKGNFAINATSSCYTGQGNDLSIYSQFPTVTQNYVVNCVLSGGGTGTGLNCSAVPGLIATPPHGGRNGGDAIALGSYDSNYLTNTVSSTNNYIVGETGDSDTCMLTWHGAHGATITGNIGVDCGGPSGASFDAVAGSGTLSNNKSFNNIQTTTSGPCCSYAFEEGLQGASGDSSFAWTLTNNLGDTIWANGSHGGEYCGVFPPPTGCPATGITESGNTWGSGAFPSLSLSSTPSQIEAVLGAPPLIPPLPKNCVVQSPYTTQTSLALCP